MNLESNIIKMAAWVESNNRTLRIILIPLILLLMYAVYILVLETGGIRYVFSHSMYLPIVIAAIVYGAKGGLIAAIIGATLLGPFTPIDTVTNESQLTINWLYRMGFFILIGFIVGAASDLIRHYIYQLKWLIFYDRGTNLPNRHSLKEAISLLKKKAKPDRTHTLIAFSLGNSNELICNFGTETLDAVVPQIAQRVQASLKPSNIIYRVQEHTICALLDNVESTKIDRILVSLHKHLLDPIAYGNINLHGDLYIGRLEFKEVEKSPSFYVRRVNQIASLAIERNEPTVTANGDEDDKDTIENLSLLGDLKNSLDSKELTMYFQPKIDLKDGAILEAEALIRWNHPKLGFIPPKSFIPRAERSSLIDQVTMFALDRSLEQICAWNKEGIRIKVAVNVSARNFIQPNFVYNIFSLLDKHQINGSELELELTESAIMQDEDNVITALKSLRKKNIEISIDDFGTGYSSLQYLQRLPISKIKIDQSFICQLQNEKQNSSAYIIDSTIKLAHRMNLKVIAEGVEDNNTLQCLRNMGCDMAQGYHIARPTPPKEFGIWHNKCQGKFAFSAGH